MEFAYIDRHWLYMKVSMVRCSTCGEYMVRRRDIGNGNNFWNVRFCSNDIGVCDICFAKARYLLDCKLCSKRKEFPADFAYHIKKYIFDDGIDEYYICKGCVETKAQAVIRIMAEADEIEEVKQDGNDSNIRNEQV